MPEGQGSRPHCTAGQGLREAQAGQMVKEEVRPEGASLSPSSVPTRVSLEARPPGSQGRRAVRWHLADS